jgi:hypothetical protein
MPNPKDVDADVAVLLKWLNKWTEDNEPRRRPQGRRPPPPPAEEAPPAPGSSTGGDAFSAMVAAPPHTAGAMLPGPGIVPLGELPESFRKQLPQDTQWLGLDQTKLSVEAMEYLLREKVAENDRKDREWWEKNRPGEPMPQQ